MSLRFRLTELEEEAVSSQHSTYRVTTEPIRDMTGSGTPHMKARSRTRQENGVSTNILKTDLRREKTKEEIPSKLHKFIDEKI